MEEPLTDELLEKLIEEPDLCRYLEQNGPSGRSLSGYLQELLEKQGLVRSEVVRRAGINDTFGYQIFMGQRKASRDYVIMLAFAMGLTLKETDRLMQAAGVNGLYCKNRRDAIIIYCLVHGCTLHETDDELYRLGEEIVSR